MITYYVYLYRYLKDFLLQFKYLQLLKLHVSHDIENLSANFAWYKVFDFLFNKAHSKKNEGMSSKSKLKAKQAHAIFSYDEKESSFKDSKI